MDAASAPGVSRASSSRASSRAAGGGHSPEDGVYYDPSEDPTRPRYPRPKGEVGMVVDVYDAVAVNPKEFHSHHVLLTNVTDRLLEELRTFPLELIKGVFIENSLLSGVVFEKVHRGIILSVSLESPEALEALWAAHGADHVCRLLQETLVTPEMLRIVGVTRMDLRVRLWEDEKEACRDELVAGCHSYRGLSQRPTALDMVAKVKAYKKTLPDQIWRLKDEQTRFEGDLSEMLRMVKGVLPHSRQTISTLAEYDQCCQKLKERPTTNMAPFVRYSAILDAARDVIRDVTRNVYYRISQIHVSLESEKQRGHKRSIRALSEVTLARLAPDHDLTGLRHPEWANRLLAKEDRFLGFVCLIPTVIDALVDIDECIDEYMSGLKK